MKTILTVAVVLVGLAGATKSRAAEYGSFVLRNPTNNTIHYQMKWGDGDWKSHSLSPHTKRWHYCRLDDDGTAPQPYVRFDWIAGDGECTYKTYRVQFYAVDCPEYGKPHVFRYSSCGCYLYLYND